MLDEIYSDDPDDYIGGFPEHPHRGFETVTYMLDGKMRHSDHLGNEGTLGPGGMQWMTAGRGVLHSEMPVQESGYYTVFNFGSIYLLRKKCENLIIKIFRETLFR